MTANRGKNTFFLGCSFLFYMMLQSWVINVLLSWESEDSELTNIRLISLFKYLRSMITTVSVEVD